MTTQLKRRRQQRALTRLATRIAYWSTNQVDHNGKPADQEKKLAKALQEQHDLDKKGVK